MDRMHFHTMARNLALAPLALVFLLFVSIAFAQGPNITFPIAELGGCESKEQCKTYCDDPANIEACVAFAESNGLMNRDEAAQARTFAGQTGPGGCRGPECRTICADPAYRAECIAFAREHGLVPPPQGPQVNEPTIDEDKAMRVVEERGGPGGCRTKDECRAFCDIEGNMETCLAFATEHDLMSPEDLERARKMMTEGGPGGCRGMQCRAYCESPDHAEECLAFAEAQGFIPPEEAEKARKLMNATGPGGCRGIECKRHCEDPAHQKECFEFAVQNGLISEEDAARARAFMQGGGPDEFGGPPGGRFEEFAGPGGCRGPEECIRYCSEHPEECRGFGPTPSGPQDFGQDRAIEMRRFEVPPGMPCNTPEECRALYEERAGEFRDSMQGQGGSFDRTLSPPEFYPPEGMPQGGSFPPQFPPREFPGDYGGEFNAEYEGQYQQQYQPQYQQQYEGAGGEFQGFQPPGDGYQPPPQNYEPPPESFEPPPSEPTSRLPVSNFVAAVFSAVAQLLGL